MHQIRILRTQMNLIPDTDLQQEREAALREWLVSVFRAEGRHLIYSTVAIWGCETAAAQRSHSREVKRE